MIMLRESVVTDIKRYASQYPGSYTLGASGKVKIKGVMTSYIAYTNPNNVTGACYIEYSRGGKEGSFTSYDLDIWNCAQIEKKIAADCCDS